LDVQDKIKLTFEEFDPFINGALLNNLEYICNETQALNLEIQPKLEKSVDLDMDEFILKVRLEVV